MPIRNWNNLDRQVSTALLKIMNLGERRVLREYALALKEVRVEMAKLYERVVKDDGILTLAQMTKYNRLQGLDKDLARIMNKTYGITVRQIDILAEDLYDAAFFRYGWAFDQNSGVALTWGSIPEEALEAVSHNPLDLIAKNTLRITQRNRIRSAISQGLLQGKSFPQMMRGIKSAMGINTYQAMRIARTEGQRAQSEATARIYEKAEANGAVGQVIWDATLDSRTRPSHRTLDGVSKPESGLWIVSHNGAILRTTGPLMSGIASFDIQCRCRLRFEVEGYSPQIRRSREEGIIPYTTYDNWKPELNARGKFSGA
jgi:SPP1 gp7 family putative phage head morphogenesis protein